MINIELNKIYQGNANIVLDTFPDAIADVCITSPPYWGLRDYGTGTWVGGDENCEHIMPRNINRHREGDKSSLKKGDTGNNVWTTCGKCGATKKDEQIGLENTPEEYIDKLACIFDKVKRVLKSTGTLWVNIGDSYWGSGNASGHTEDTKNLGASTASYGATKGHSQKKHSLYKPKDLVGIPWMLAFELRKRGWYLRSDIIWNKPNPMPESVTDRPTKAHEYIFLLSKSAKYYYDYHAIKEPIAESTIKDKRLHKENYQAERIFRGFPGSVSKGNGLIVPVDDVYNRNKRSVWTITTKPYSEAHFATFPEDLIEPCILAGSSEHGCCSNCGNPYERIVEKKFVKHENWFGDKQKVRNSRGSAGNSYNECVGVETKGWQPTCQCNASVVPSTVLDIFSGSGTTVTLARKKNRNGIGIELNPNYIKLSDKRMFNELGIFI